MNKVEAIQSVRDMCERHKQSHKHYPSVVQVGGEVWRALVTPGYVFPPGTPFVAVPLMELWDIFTALPDETIPVVKVTPC